MLIVLGLAVIVSIPLTAAWRKWLVTDQRVIPSTRKILFLTGLCVATLVLLEYVAFAFYTSHIGGFGTDFPAVFRWTRTGFWGSVLALLLVSVGRGKSRAFGLTSAGLMVVMWIILSWGE
jgi:hypothetical protein